MRAVPPVLALLLTLSACAARVPSVPRIVTAAVPLHAPSSTWFAQGRLTLSAPGHLLSCTALVRTLGQGRVRLALVSDEGLQLLDATAGPDGTQLHQALPELVRTMPPLARLVLQAYGEPHEGPLAWAHRRLVATSGRDRRWYGGDPVLLRAVTGPGLDLELGDFQPFDQTLLPLTVRARAPWDVLTITLHLEPGTLRPLRASRVSAPLPGAVP